MNNTTELHALANGLVIAKKNNYWPFFVEGDSNVATQDSKKLQQGRNIAKVSECWHINRV